MQSVRPTLRSAEALNSLLDLYNQLGEHLPKRLELDWSWDLWFGLFMMETEALLPLQSFKGLYGLQRRKNELQPTTACMWRPIYSVDFAH